MPKSPPIAMVSTRKKFKRPTKATSGATIHEQKSELHLPKVEHALKAGKAPPERMNAPNSKKNAPKRKAKHAGKGSK